METELQPHHSHPSYPLTLRKTTMHKRINKIPLGKELDADIKTQTCCLDPTLLWSVTLNRNAINIADNFAMLWASWR